MKRLLLPVLIAFFGATGNLATAQTIPSVHNGLHLGGQTYVTILTPGATEFSTGTPAGANQTWSFANLPVTNQQLAEVLSRAAAPKPTSYPAANKVVKIGDEYSYIEDTNGILKEHAAYESTQNYSLENTDPADKMRFPFTFNSTYSDNFAGSVVLGGNTIPRNGVVTVTGEGYGTLITPLHTFTNVLKVKTEEVANPLTLFSENTITYDWYEAGVPIPVLRLTRRTTMAGTLYSGFLNHVTIWGTKEDLAAKLNLQVFPNPAASELTIQFKTVGSETVKLSLLNVLGQEITKVPYAEKSPIKTLKVDVSNYPKGVYFLKLETGGSAAAKRIVVQ